MNPVHILNGDALKEQFPTDQISGELVVMKECLVDGNVAAESLDEFIDVRAETLEELYQFSKEEYYEKAAPELRRINSIGSGDVNLWFEDDLFCQVNLWFVCHLLHQKSSTLFLIRPEKHTQYGFGGLNQGELIQAFENKHRLNSVEVTLLSNLWSAYQHNDIQQLNQLSDKIAVALPFVPIAIQAHLDRHIADEKEGKPARVLRQIMEELGEEDFSAVFREFARREPIYGFGDLQVKRIYDILKQ